MPRTYAEDQYIQEALCAPAPAAGTQAVGPVSLTPHAYYTLVLLVLDPIAVGGSLDVLLEQSPDGSTDWIPVQNTARTVPESTSAQTVLFLLDHQFLAHGSVRVNLAPLGAIGSPPPHTVTFLARRSLHGATLVEARSTFVYEEA